MIATNNGSLPWRGGPMASELDDAHRRNQMGKITREELQALQDRATRDAVRLQVEAGLDLPTDGLVRRPNPIHPIVTHLSGITAGPSRDHFPGGGGPYPVPIVEDEIAWSGPILVEDFLFATEGSSKPLKVVLT